MRRLLVSVLVGSFLAAGLVIFFTPDPAEAIPLSPESTTSTAFPCHSAWPLLNASGRKFKESGYKFSESMEKDKNQVVAPGMLFDKYFPITVLTKSYIYDKEKGRTRWSGLFTSTSS